MAEKILEDKGLVIRHSLVELIEHWAIALSGLILVVTGFFQMPTANRYYIASIPGLAWSGDFFTTLKMHYVASVIFVVAAFFHVVFHGMRGEKGLMPKKGDMKTSIAVIKSFFGKGEEPPFHKYLPEQRLAYAGMAVIIVLLILSGLVKTYKNIYAPDMSLAVVLTATWVHNIAFILFFLAFFAHMAAIILKPNRPMIRAIFTGAVRLDYARHRHPLWMAELEGKAETTTEQQTPLVSADAEDAEEDTANTQAMQTTQEETPAGTEAATPGETMTKEDQINLERK
ncbi:MAG: cytochrome b/b6 domain-containing protein [Deltaproteobacteria bacterium]|nr:cytochrome b/b6 domain-containing protein [Deltaproteobacteria bacterium]